MPGSLTARALAVALPLLLTGCLVDPPAPAASGGPPTEPCSEPDPCIVATVASGPLDHDPSWEGVPSDRVAVGRLTVDGTEAIFRRLGEPSFLNGSAYRLDAANRTLAVRAGVSLPEENAEVLELVPRDNPAAARLYIGAGRFTAGPDVPEGADHGPTPYWAILTPTFLRFEAFLESCPRTVTEGHPGAYPPSHEEPASYHAETGAPVTVVFEGQPESRCPDAAVRVEHLGLFGRAAIAPGD